MRAADALIRALAAEGVDVLFGLPGGASLPIHDALHGSGMRHVLVRHEAAAGHAAEGYARASGRVGVALVTSGPGATNLVTPLADAQMDSVPLVAITGQVRSDLRGTDAFQETDVISMTAPIVKHAIACERPRDVAPAIHEAFTVACSGRPGPGARRRADRRRAGAGRARRRARASAARARPHGAGRSRGGACGSACARARRSAR